MTKSQNYWKTKEIKIQRDVFGRLLYASLKHNIDIEKALNYPLAPISFSFCHTDGTICKTSKSVIINELVKHQAEVVDPPEADIHLVDDLFCHTDGTICKTSKSVIINELVKHQAEVVDPPEADIHLVDDFYFLHTLKNLPESYSDISKHILKIITYNRKEVHIIFDKYETPSIKDYEHYLRNEENIQYDVRKENKGPAEFIKLLRSRNFKEKFVEFLIENWATDEMILLITVKTVKLNYDKCYVYEVSMVSEKSKKSLTTILLATTKKPTPKLFSTFVKSEDINSNNCDEDKDDVQAETDEASTTESDKDENYI
ncbi:hypothetical protein PV325_005760 [Microctonus aethiopoides]|nr:hypothetical protein PV325_005760 [Microctonus aethiopoides]